MDSPDLNASSDDDVRLKAALRELQPELLDNGFSTRVLATLPPRRAARQSGIRILAIALGAAAGATIAYSQNAGPHTGEFAAAASRLSESAARIAALAESPTHGLALIIAALALVFVLRRSQHAAPI